ncbi:CBO0543 family protein [Bacillus sp. EB01]|uniref:CBO0543 family protein n=1 Tax=Bacillus sp. EB01 TaxID=1347086 RepID=UPI003FA440D2
MADCILPKRIYFLIPGRNCRKERLCELFKAFNISAVFGYLLYPVICVYFIKATKQSNILVVLFKNVLFTTPMVLAETWLEKHTNLIKYKKGWNWRHSYASIFGTFLAVRTIAYIINTIARKKI